MSQTSDRKAGAEKSKLAKRWLWAGVFCLLAAFQLFVELPGSEPRVSGTSVSGWLVEFGQGNEETATLAFKKLGPRAVPWLLAELDAPDEAPARLFGREIRSLIPAWLGVYLRPLRSAEERESVARSALFRLGEQLPELEGAFIAELWAWYPSSRRLNGASAGLAGIGGSASQSLLRLYASGNPVFQHRALEVFRQMGAEGAVCIPRLTALVEAEVRAVQRDLPNRRELCRAFVAFCPVAHFQVQDWLSSPERKLRLLGLEMLAWMPDAHLAVFLPKLEAMLTVGVESSELGRVGYVLERLGQRAEVLIPSLTRLLGHAKEDIRILAALAHWRVSGASESALAILLQHVQLTESEVALHQKGILSEAGADPSPSHLREAVFVLAQMGASARGALPALNARAAQHSPADVPQLAWAIWQISRSPDAVLPTLDRFVRTSPAHFWNHTNFPEPAVEVLAEMSSTENRAQACLDSARNRLLQPLPGMMAGTSWFDEAVKRGRENAAKRAPLPSSR